MAKTERKPYRMKSGLYRRRVDGESRLFKPGDGQVFYPSSAEIRQLGDQIEPVEGGRRRPPPPKQALPPEKESDNRADKSSEKENPTQVPSPKPEKLQVEQELGGGWYLLTDGRKVHGKAALGETLKNG